MWLTMARNESEGQKVMFGNRKPMNKWRALVGIMFSLVSLIVLAYIAVSLISGRGLGLSRVTSLFSARTPVDIAEDLEFDVGRDRVFADLGGSIAAAGSLGIQVLDFSGNELLRDSFRMTSPAIRSKNGRAVAYDIGARDVRVFNRSQVITSVEANGAIISASINRNGWLCVSTQESAGLRGFVNVYNDRGNAIYRVSLASGYAFSAVLSPDNRSLAVLNLMDEGSRIAFFHGLSRDVHDSEFILPGELILDISYLQNDSLLAVSTNMLITLDRSGTGTVLYDFFDRRLGGFLVGDGVIVLYLLDYGIGHAGRLITLSESGSVLGELVTNREIISMSQSDGYLAVIKNDGLVFYNNELEELSFEGEAPSVAGLTDVLVFGDGLALATNDHSAIVVKS